MTMNKPPLGLMPEWRHKELRLQEIRDAIQRYLDADQPIPVNWVAEEYALRNWLENRVQPAAEPKQKDWEIVKYAYNYEENEKRHLFSSEKEFLEEVGHIYAVRRLSDNEVFAVGDEIDFGNFGNQGWRKIERFQTCIFDETEITAYDGAFGLGIQRWAKRPTRTPLFTTTDGKPIYDGDEYWFIFNNDEMSHTVIAAKKATGLPPIGMNFSSPEAAKNYLKKTDSRTPLFITTDGKPVYKGDGCWVVVLKDLDQPFRWPVVNSVPVEGSAINERYFSTEEAANEWIAQNKPMYSLADIQKALHGQWGTQGAVDNVIHYIKKSKNAEV